MTLYKPTLVINELKVLKDGHEMLNVRFHTGLNIVRGHNSSGKTTTLDFIAHTLGAEEIPWKKEALLCDYSLLEVLLNDKPVTLGRSVGEGTQAPLHIYWGPLSDAMKSRADGWEKYPFRRSQNKLSFTQALLLALDMPEAQGDGASNLTMHQFLRVMYADQPSLHSPIFRVDAFDSALTRETVGNYLAGVYDDELYSAQLSRRDLEKSLSAAEAELRSIFTVLAKSKQDINPEFFAQQIVSATQKREAMRNELASLKSERSVTVDKKRSSDESASRVALDAAKQQLNQTLYDIARLDAELEDSRRFVDEVRSRLAGLSESESARSYFGSMPFHFCPCCLAEIKPAQEGTNRCILCKADLHVPTGENQVLRMRNELRIQLKESSTMIAAREAEIARLKSAVPGLREALRKLERKYMDSARHWTSDLEQRIEDISREIGALDQEIKGLHENQRLSTVIRDLQQRRDNLAHQIADLDSRIEMLQLAQDKRKRDVFLTIVETLSRLLKLDLYRQEEFRTAESVTFSFIDNIVSVDGSTKFSESSTVVLRHLFHLALLSASTRIREMRFPRFLILDGIEDGGMELMRSHRLQEIIAGECETYDVEFQVIMATSQIAPSLNNEKFVVGRNFTEDNRALAFR